MRKILRTFYTVFCVYPLFYLLSVITKNQPNKNGWDQRALVMQFNQIGDVILSTSTLRHYGHNFKEITLLLKKENPLCPVLKPPVRECLYADIKKFNLNPFYGLSLIKSLSGIGFKTVIINSPLPPPESLILAKNLGAENIYCYSGENIFINNPKNIYERIYVWLSVFLQKNFLVTTNKFAKEDGSRITNVIRHYEALYKNITKDEKNKDFSTQISIPENETEKIINLIKKNGHESDSFCVIGLGAGNEYRQWPIERFAAISKILLNKNMPLYLVGSKNEAPLGHEFEKIIPQVQNLIGKLSLSETAALINECRFCLSNETSLVHIAIALKKPSLCILGTGHLGRCSLYGYPEMNYWVYKKTPCLCDNWKCGLHKKISPCIEAIGISDITAALEKILSAEKPPTHKTSNSFIIEYPL